MGDGERVEKNKGNDGAPKAAEPVPEMVPDEAPFENEQAGQVTGLQPARRPKKPTTRADDSGERSATTESELTKAYWEAKGHLKAVLRKGAQRPEASIANACEYLLEDDSRFEPLVAIIANEELRKEKALDWQYLYSYGPRLDSDNLMKVTDSYGLRLRDGTDRVLIAVQVNGAHGPAGLVAGPAGSDEDQMLSTIAHEVQHVLDGSTMPDSNEFDRDELFERFKTEYRATLLFGQKEGGVLPHTGMAYDFEAKHSGEEIEARKQRVRSFLLDPKGSYKQFAKRYETDREFRSLVDDFISNLELTDTMGGGDGQYAGGMNLINPPRIDALRAAVSRSSLRFIGQDELPWEQPARALDELDRHFINNSEDWRTFVEGTLEDPRAFGDAMEGS